MFCSWKYVKAYEAAEWWERCEKLGGRDEIAVGTWLACSKRRESCLPYQRARASYPPGGKEPGRPAACASFFLSFFL